MASGSAFGTASRRAADELRRLPVALRRDLPEQIGATVVEPLAAQIARSWRGPHARALAASTRAVVERGEALVVAGGASSLVSGGATGSDLVPGNEFGGGSRVVTLTSRRGNSYRRHTTRQFPRGGQHAMFGNLDAKVDQAFDGCVKAVDRLIGQVLGNG